MAKHRVHAPAQALIAALALLSTATAAPGCVSRTPSDLRGYADLELHRSDQPGAPVPIEADSSPDKFRAQINDRGAGTSLGDGCELDVTVDLNDADSYININTYPDEIPDLLAGSPQTIDATNNTGRSIVLNAATVYYRTPDGSWYSRGAGSLYVHPLPAPTERLQIEFQDVLMHHTTSDATALLTGTIETTFIGAVDTSDGNRACPQIELYPGGMIM